ncbi:YeiH family protein [Nocardioides sediminis]|uniref:YeiH family protein n=1 Tax=Nocardioides sediminis TaxID=433648 RepID=UPI00131F3C94|nr:putative sulfate exporter family transporter [Nocardioides sediminis]
MTVLAAVDQVVRPPATNRPRRVLLALGVLSLGVLGASVCHLLVPQVGVLTWAIGLGILAANAGLVPAGAASQLGSQTRRLLRVGIVLLGFSVSFASIAALGLPLVALVAGSLVATLLLTLWLGRRLGVGRARTLLVGTGVAICGASAIAAMEETAGAEEDDVAAAIAMVTLFGTLALVALPLLQGPFGLTDVQLGAWAGASVHEVGQVVAAAGPAGPAAVAVAVVVKLTRVVMLAPVVAVAGVVTRLRSARPGAGTGRPALVPLFVLGFLACAALRSAGVVPATALDWIAQVQVVALGAALFGMGCSVRLAHLWRNGGAVMVVAAAATLFLGTVTLAGVLLVAPAT